MKVVFALLITKLVTLAGSLAITAGLVGLFTFREILEPYLIVLWVGGFLAIAVGEGGAWLIAQREAARDDEESTS